MGSLGARNGDHFFFQCLLSLLKFPMWGSGWTLWVSKDSSFKKAQECLDVVAKEFKFQGCKMRGPTATLKTAGKSGQHPGNIARDIHRKFAKMQEVAS